MSAQKGMKEKKIETTNYLNRKVLSDFLNKLTEWLFLILFGSVFHSVGPHTLKLQSPYLFRACRISKFPDLCKRRQ